MADQRSGVIHDLGYRHYEGPRDGVGTIARTLYVTGLRHAFGLGRSGRSKILPFLLLALCTLPAAIVVGVVTIVGLSDLPLTYAGYTNQVQLLVSLFAAAQAPVLFSRDLRYRSIVLYLARPLPAHVIALTRWASLATALLVFTVLPLLVLYAGGLLAGLDVSEQTTDLLKAVTLLLLVAAMLAGITGFISSVSLRRGFAVVGSIVALVVVPGVVTAVQAITAQEDADQVGVVAGLASPWSLTNGLASAWDAGVTVFTPPDGSWVVVYLAVALLVAVAGVAAIVARFAKVGSR
ncbi:ABC transporter permease [Nocardioides sp. P5_C9_2]